MPHCDSILYTDYTLHIASLPRHRGLLRKIMSHNLKTFSIPLRGVFLRRTSIWAFHRSEYSRFMVNDTNGKGGSINSKVSPLLYSAHLCVTMMYAVLPPMASGYASLSLPLFMLTMVVDTAFRVPCPLRGYRQFALFFADIGPNIFNRYNLFRNQTARHTPNLPIYVLACIQKKRRFFRCL